MNGPVERGVGAAQTHFSALIKRVLSLPKAPFSAGSQLINKPSPALTRLSEYYRSRSLWPEVEANWGKGQQCNIIIQ